jgi:hypothetical protein
MAILNSFITALAKDSVTLKKFRSIMLENVSQIVMDDQGNEVEMFVKTAYTKIFENHFIDTITLMHEVIKHNGFLDNINEFMEEILGLIVIT